MALKEFGDSKPRTRDKNWKEDIPLAQLPRLDTWYAFRLVGGVFTYAQHWVTFTNKAGEKKTYPVDCANWNRETEDTSHDGGCPACEAGIKHSVKYMLNVISRADQDKGDSDPIRAFEIPPTVMRQVMDLKDLNKNRKTGKTYHVTHPKFGMDVNFMKQRSAKRSGMEWQIQRGERSKLTPEEIEYELIDFEEFWLDPDIHKIREDLKRHGYIDDPSKKKRASKDEDEDEDDFSFSSGDSEESSPRSKRRKKKRRPAPPTADDDDFDDEDEEELDDEEEEEEAPPSRKSRRKKKRRPAPPVDDEDEDDDDDDDDDDDEYDI